MNIEYESRNIPRLKACHEKTKIPIQPGDGSISEPIFSIRHASNNLQERATVFDMLGRDVSGAQVCRAPGFQFEGQKSNDVRLVKKMAMVR